MDEFKQLGTTILSVTEKLDVEFEKYHNKLSHIESLASDNRDDIDKQTDLLMGIKELLDKYFNMQ